MKFKLVQTMKAVKTGRLLPNGTYEYVDHPIGEIIAALRSWQHGGRVYPIRGGYIEVGAVDMPAFMNHFGIQGPENPGGRAIEVPDAAFAAAVADWAKANTHHASVSADLEAGGNKEAKKGILSRLFGGSTPAGAGSGGGSGSGPGAGGPGGGGSGT
jgi:hypothetical protein